MFVDHTELETTEFAPGILLRRLNQGLEINAVHWNFKDGVSLPAHQHIHEQFGYIIQGGFQVTIGEQTRLLKAGDAYYVPPNTMHQFVAVGETEAIDVFTPVREVGYK